MAGSAPQTIALPAAQMSMKLSTMFAKFKGDDTGGRLDNTTVLNLLSKSKLPSETINDIWRLSDKSCRGSLNRREFVVAMHLATVCKAGGILPSNLPIHFKGWDWVFPTVQEQELNDDHYFDDASPDDRVSRSPSTSPPPPPIPDESPPPESLDETRVYIRAPTREPSETPPPIPVGLMSPLSATDTSPLQPLLENDTSTSLKFVLQPTFIETYSAEEYDRSNPDFDPDKNALEVQMEMDYELERQKLDGKLNAFDEELEELRKEEEERRRSSNSSNRDGADSSGKVHGIKDDNEILKVPDLASIFNSFVKNNNGKLGSMEDDLSAIRSAEEHLLPTDEMNEIEAMRAVCTDALERDAVEHSLDVITSERTNRLKRFAEFVGKRRQVSKLITTMLHIETPEDGNEASVKPGRNDPRGDAPKHLKLAPVSPTALHSTPIPDEQPPPLHPRKRSSIEMNPGSDTAPVLPPSRKQSQESFGGFDDPPSPQRSSGPHEGLFTGLVSTQRN